MVLLRNVELNSLLGSFCCFLFLLYLYPTPPSSRASLSLLVCTSEVILYPFSSPSVCCCFIFRALSNGVHPFLSADCLWCVAFFPPFARVRSSNMSCFQFRTSCPFFQRGYPTRLPPHLPKKDPLSHRCPSFPACCAASPRLFVSPDRFLLTRVPLLSVATVDLFLPSFCFSAVIYIPFFAPYPFPCPSIPKIGKIIFFARLCEPSC